MKSVAPTPNHRWDDLRFLLAVARAGTLLGAGRALGVTTSTVGRRLRALEEQLGVQLFERTSEGVIATLAAERLLPWAEGVEQAHEAFARAVRGLEREPVGRVRVTGPPGLVDHFLAPAAGRLRQAFPRIELVVDASVAYADLSRGEADIALRGRRPERGDLVFRRLGPFASCVIGCAGTYAGAPPVDDLGRLPWLQWGDDLAHIPDARFVAAHVPASAIVLRTSSFAAQLAAARAGVGVMLAAAPFARLDGVTAVPLAGAAAAALNQAPAPELYLVGHQALRRVPRVAVVWEFLLDLLDVHTQA